MLRFTNTFARFALIAVLATAFAAGCESKSEDDKGGESEEKAPAGPPEGWVEVDIADLGIKAIAPEGIEPTKMGGEVMLMSMDVSMMLSTADDSTPATAAEGIEKAEAAEGKDIETIELDNGYVVTWSTGDGEGGTWAMVGKVDVGGTAIECQTDVGFESLRDGAVDVCRYLKK